MVSTRFDSRKIRAFTVALACIFSISSAPALAEDSYAAKPAEKPAEGDSAGMPEIKYELGKQPLKEHPGGASNEATARNFPISKGMAGVSMFLKPGALKKLH